ncbi:HAMP domain-containing sensor histidine kinase [Clostridium sp.]|uniref:sensor histidine kinase n=1 Tax=Clostridium sp. TaxID=1506 RepID=UPI001A4471B6|nr:HAMP domain-containing sensor histidine kinase [Clostridium sp.]MBK5243331.1 HAMP domain-containing histidine kinase [Clostridium sp.]
MKKYSRIYNIIMILITGLFIFLEIEAVSFSFKMDIEREIEALQNINLEYANSLANSIEMLENHTDESDSVLKFVAKNLYTSMSNHHVIYQVLSKDNVIYNSRLLNLNKNLPELPEAEQIFLEYYQEDQKNYIVITSSVEIYDQSYFISTILGVTEVYAQRDTLVQRYSLLLLIILTLLALGLYLLVKSFEKNVRISEKIAQVEAASKIQEEFTASFAHECRTPLTSIIGYSDMLLTMDLNKEEQIESLEYILGEGKRLERLINQMMVLTNLRDDEITIENVEIQSLLSETYNLLNNQMQLKGINFTVEYEPGTILGVEDLYLSILINILDNARKAVEYKGNIYLSGKHTSTTYKIVIKDDGCGMDSKVLEKMMEPFYMADQSRTRREGGAGLGMAIVSRIVKRLDIHLEVESTVDKGTTFTLDIPLCSSDEHNGKAPKVMLNE